MNKIRRRSVQVRQAADRKAQRRIERRACDRAVAEGLIGAGYSAQRVETWVAGYYARIRIEALEVYAELRGRK